MVIAGTIREITRNVRPMCFQPETSKSVPSRDKHDVIQLSAEISIGAQPSVGQLQELRGRGFASIINLRCAGEEGMDPKAEGRAAAEAGLAYGHVPVPVDGFSGEVIALFRKELGRLTEPVFVHCAAGERAGAVVLAHLAIETGGCVEHALENATSPLFGDETLRDRVRECIAAHEAGELERLRTFRWICR